MDPRRTTGASLLTNRRVATPERYEGRHWLRSFAVYPAGRLGA
jgi:hypothetical protein